MQTQDTTTSTRWCPRCQTHLPLSAFGSHNYCRECYRGYLAQWKAERRDPQRDRLAAAFVAIREGRCAVCGDTTDSGKTAICQHCNMAILYLGEFDENYWDRLMNLVDYSKGRFDAALRNRNFENSKK